MLTALFLAVLFPCLSCKEGTWLEGEMCVGFLKEDSTYDFELPNAVAVNVQNPECDAEWTIDQIYTAILDGNSAYFSHPFKKLTRYGISASYCPSSVRFHVSCSKYSKDLSCFCTNSTASNYIVNTTLPSRETSSSAMKTGLLKRQHYCTIAVAATFIQVLVIF